MPRKDVDLPDVDDSEEFDIPENINEEDDSPTVSHSVLNAPLNKERNALNRRKMTHPSGDWKKTEPWEGTLSTFKNDKAPGDVDPEGRTVIAVFGRPEERIDSLGNPHQPLLYCRYSPDERFKRDDPSQFDSLYKMWMKAETVYFAITGMAPDEVGDMYTVLKEENYVIVTGSDRDTGELFIYGLKPNRRR